MSRYRKHAHRPLSLLPANPGDHSLLSHPLSTTFPYTRLTPLPHTCSRRTSALFLAQKPPFCLAVLAIFCSICLIARPPPPCRLPTSYVLRLFVRPPARRTNPRRHVKPVLPARSAPSASKRCCLHPDTRITVRASPQPLHHSDSSTAAAHHEQLSIRHAL